MPRVLRLSGSALLAAALLLSSLRPALQERLSPSEVLTQSGAALIQGYSMLLDGGARLVEDLLPGRRLEAAGLAKAGAAALLAMLVGCQQLLEARGEGSAEAPVDLTVAHSPGGRGEGAAACGPEGVAGHWEAAPARTSREDLCQCEYAGFMDSMYEDSFDGLGANDLVSNDCTVEVNCLTAADQDDNMLKHEWVHEAAAFGHLVGQLPAEEASELEFVEKDAKQGERQDEPLEALAKECEEVLESDYAETMEHGYRGLRSQLVESGALLNT